MATLGKAHGLLALEGHWSGKRADGIAHGAEAVALLTPQPDQRWWLGMAHFYLAMNHLLTGDFDAALAEAAARTRSARRSAIRGCRPTPASRPAGSRRRAAAAPRRSRSAARGLEQAPDRVSRAYASMILGYALLEHGEHREALERLRPTVAELEGFGFPQWQALAAVFAAEALRREGRLDEAESMVERGLRVATGAEYWYAVGFAQRTAGHILRDKGSGRGNARLAEAAKTFNSIGATFEAQRSRKRYLYSASHSDPSSRRIRAG